MILKAFKAAGWAMLMLILCATYPGAALFNLFLRMEQKRVLTRKPQP